MDFASFVFIAVFVVVNLFIAVVLNNLEAAKVELQAGKDRRNPQRALLEAIEETKARLEDLERRLREGGDDHASPCPLRRGERVGKASGGG